MDRRDLWCLTGLAAIATVAFADVLFGGNSFYHPDLFLYHYPMKYIVREAMLSGEFPFWNRLYSGGQPLAANPAYELFYPLQWLILVGPYRLGFALHIVSHVYLALAGMYLVLREMRLGRPASLFGAISFGMGGLLIGCMTILPTFFVWALAPVVGWSVLRALRQPSASRLGAAALLAGMQLMIAEPVAIEQVWTLLLAGGLIAVGIRRTFIVLPAIAVASFLVAAVQIVPAFDHVRDSIRSVGFSFDTVKDNAMPPARPIELVIPHWYGRYNPIQPTYWGGAVFNRGFPYLPSLYNGVAIAVLALAGLMSLARGSGAVAILSLLSYFLAIGDRMPLLRLLYQAGLARGIRYPEKFAAMGIVAITLFAATVADRLLSGDRRTRRAAIIAAAICATVSLIPVLWPLMPGWPQSFADYWHLAPARLQLAGLAHTNWLVGLAMCSGLLLLLAMFRRLEIRRWLILALAFVLLDIAFTIDGMTARAGEDFFTPPEVLRLFDRDHDNYTVLHRGEWKKDETNYKALQRLLGPWFSRNALAPYSLARWGVRSTLEGDFDETNLLPTRALLNEMIRLRDTGYPAWAESFGAIANVRYIADFRTVLQAAAAPDREHASIVRLTRIPNTGQYYFAQEVSSADPAAFMINPGIHRPIAFVDSPMPQPGKGRVLRAVEHANSATVDVECASSALLVATVTRQKYWTATIDGHPTPLLAVNVAYQGLVVPAGRHVIEMRYRNPLVIGSAAVSILATAACLAAIAVQASRKRMWPEKPAPVV
jgi:hypothetical protein